MSTTLLSHVAPIQGVEYDHAKPETRQAWLDQRAGGITATEIRDWGNGSKRREIIIAKVTGQTEDLSHILAIDHGNRREPVIAEWARGRFGIEPCNHVYAHGENPRHLASPDGISLDPFNGELLVGTPDAVLSEIKTSKHDLTPGRMDAAHVLVEIDFDSYFARANYYTQMQWQMYVMNAVATLFIHEQHDGTIDAETGTYRPVGPPQWAIIPRDEALIRRLVDEVAPKALAEIDAARLAASAGELPPASELPSEQAMLVADLLAARDAEAVAKAKKDKAWAALQAYYLGDGKPDLSIDGGFAKVSVSTSTTMKPEIDMDGARKKAPKMVESYEALIKRFTRMVPSTTQRLTVTPSKDIAK